MPSAIARYAFAVITVLPAFPLHAADITTVDGGGGQSSSIAISADGLPIVAYARGAALRIAKCTHPGCGSAILESVEDDQGNSARGQYVSLAVRASGSPVMTWYDDVNRNLAFARCPSPDCSGPDILRTLDDSADDTGRYTSMALDAEGRVHAAFVNTTTNSLHLVRCLALACVNTTVNSIDGYPGGSVGTGASMALGSDGFPVVAYQDVTAREILLAKCQDAGCVNVVRTVIDVDLTIAPGVGPDLAIGADGLPIISFYDGAIGALKFVKCHSPACDGTIAPTMRLIDVDPQRDNGRYSAIAVRPDGTPVIAYQSRALDSTGGSGLRVAECISSTCAGNTRFVTLDFRPGEITGTDIDIVIGSDGGAVISYYDNRQHSLKVAKCNPTTCVGPGDRIFHGNFQFQ